jgi:ribosomal protein S11
MDEVRKPNRRVRRPRYADVMSTFAVVLALAGTSYAAGLAPNAVKSKQIKNGAVRSVDVKDGNLLAVDFKAGQLVAGPQGPAGSPGTPGQPGQTGETGPTYGHTRTAGLPALGTGENFLAQTDFTLPAAGPVFITATSNNAKVDCTSPAGTVLGVVIDGTVVPGTTRDATSGVSAAYGASGVSASLSAGAHTAFVAGTCVGAPTSNGMTFLQPSVTVILLGSG